MYYTGIYLEGIRSTKPQSGYPVSGSNTGTNDLHNTKDKCYVLD
jgi:hypothetical protein